MPLDYVLVQRGIWQYTPGHEKPIFERFLTERREQREHREQQREQCREQREQQREQREQLTV